MYRFCLFFCVFVTMTCFTRGLHPDKCQMFPKEKHCFIEYSVRDLWPHQIRYVYNWYSKSCFAVRWSANCPPVSDPPSSNNFRSEEDCLDQCGGWA